MSTVEGNRRAVSVDAPAEVDSKHMPKAVEHARDGIIRRSERKSTNLAVVQKSQLADQAQKPEKSMLEDTSSRREDVFQTSHPQNRPSKIRARSSSSPTAPHQEHSSAANAQHKSPTPLVRNTKAVTVASLMKIA